MFPSENHLEESQESWFKRTVLNMIKGFKELNKYLSELEKDRNEYRNEAQGTTNI